jgi:class 3 adenylate cyclase
LLFEVQFRDSATQIITALTHGLEDKGAAAAAAASFLGAVGSRVGTFPNVTYPGFTAFAEAELALAQARALSFNPLLPAAALPGWTAYARASLALLGAPPATLATINATAASTGVYERNASNAVVRSSPSRPFTAPVWQIAPWATNAAAVFYDLHSQLDRQRALDAVLASGRPAVTSIITLVQDRVANVSRASGIVFAPVFDAAAANTSAVVGFTSVVFSWDSFLAASLPAFITGIDAVLSSSANNVTVTFRIAGGAVVATSAGDTHEAALNALVRSADLSGVDLDVPGADLDLSDADLDGSAFTLRLYPTAALRDSYYTRNPRDACVGVVCIVVSLALVFWLYDMAVTYHSGELAEVASVASRIVASVFPETVRNRLFKHAAAKGHASASLQHGGGGSGVGGGNHRGGGGGRSSGGGDSTVSLSSSTGAFASRGSGAVTAAVKFMRKLAARRDASSPRSSSLDGTTSGTGGGIAHEAAIADHFDDVTILFADLVSFTRWSADVTPERVFSVLEAVFGAFDAEARKLVRHDAATRALRRGMFVCWGLEATPTHTLTLTLRLAPLPRARTGRVQSGDHRRLCAPLSLRACIMRMRGLVIIPSRVRALTLPHRATRNAGYMAATGLPSPNAAHATVMADFALQLEPLLARACDLTGVTPGQLSLRVGLHSGSVTAGVLRADRSRFQLFGDTVRMRMLCRAALRWPCAVPLRCCAALALPCLTTSRPHAHSAGEHGESHGEHGRAAAHPGERRHGGAAARGRAAHAGIPRQSGGEGQRRAGHILAHGRPGAAAAAWRERRQPRRPRQRRRGGSAWCWCCRGRAGRRAAARRAAGARGQRRAHGRVRAAHAERQARARSRV